MKNLKPGGFPELLPAEQIIADKIQEIITTNYGLYGYANIQTPAVELNDILTSKGGDESISQIFGLYGFKQGVQDQKDYSLHFDLTVPLARYIIEHENNLIFPFKRYQIQKVWRGERQQKGRFKELIQSDIDVISPNLPINYDVEIISVLYKTLIQIFQFLQINTTVEVHFNNRKFINALCDYLKLNNTTRIQFFKLLDSYYKLNIIDFQNQLKIIVGNNYNLVIEFFQTKNIEILPNKNTELINSFAEINYVMTELAQQGINVIFDVYITRGLDYYTGTVFECFLPEHLEFGTVSAGGRYDNLVEGIRKISASKGRNYEGIGGSIGLTRLISVFQEANLLTHKLALTEILIFNLPDINNQYREQIATICRDQGYKTEVYYLTDKMNKQFDYASAKNIIRGIFAGSEEENKKIIILKNLQTRTSQEIKLDELQTIIKNLKQ